VLNVEWLMVAINNKMAKEETTAKTVDAAKDVAIDKTMVDNDKGFERKD
jgi:hypothetical protein